MRSWEKFLDKEVRKLIREIKLETINKQKMKAKIYDSFKQLWYQYRTVFGMLWVKNNKQKVFFVTIQEERSAIHVEKMRQLKFN